MPGGRASSRRNRGTRRPGRRCAPGRRRARPRRRARRVPLRSPRSSCRRDRGLGIVAAASPMPRVLVRPKACVACKCRPLTSRHSTGTQPCLGAGAHHDGGRAALSCRPTSVAVVDNCWYHQRQQVASESKTRNTFSRLEPTGSTRRPKTPFPSCGRQWPATPRTRKRR